MLARLLKRPVCRLLASRSMAMSAEEKSEIAAKVAADKVVVFMKGVPDQPQCGFSRAVIQVLDIHGVDKFSAHNVLADDALRENIKEFSDWPTIPQVYVGGEFIGGCDIIIQLHQSGELIDVLKEVGIKSLVK
eukprot:sb/3474923/